MKLKFSDIHILSHFDVFSAVLEATSNDFCLRNM